jgi:hypothetical protein
MEKTKMRKKSFISVCGLNGKDANEEKISWISEDANKERTRVT